MNIYQKINKFCIPISETELSPEFIVRNISILEEYLKGLKERFSPKEEICTKEEICCKAELEKKDDEGWLPLKDYKPTVGDKIYIKSYVKIHNPKEYVELEVAYYNNNILTFESDQRLENWWKSDLLYKPIFINKIVIDDPDVEERKSLLGKWVEITQKSNSFYNETGRIIKIGIGDYPYCISFDDCVDNEDETFKREDFKVLGDKKP